MEKNAYFTRGNGRAGFEAIPGGWIEKKIASLECSQGWDECSRGIWSTEGPSNAAAEKESFHSQLLTGAAISFHGYLLK